MDLLLGFLLMVTQTMKVEMIAMGWRQIVNLLMIDYSNPKVRFGLVAMVMSCCLI